tara:strand:- start:47 stop:421 length:375 start_codon:yes stop_codon:yes gene_type:complete
MKFNPKLKHEISTYLDYIILVEGKKDKESLESLGFLRVYTIHETGIPLKERLLQISKEVTKKDKVCILTDFDKKGKQLYLKIKTAFHEIGGVKLDSTLRGILIKSGVSHIEGLSSFMEKVNQIG